MRQGAPTGPTTTHRIAIGRGRRLTGDPATLKSSPGRLPRVVLQLALAHEIDRRLRIGEVPELATVARRAGLTRARVTQILGLLLLAPDIQEAILSLPPFTRGRDPLPERALRPLVAEPDWTAQRRRWARLRPSEDTSCPTSAPRP